MLIEPGKYRGRISDYGVEEARAEGKHAQVFIEFELIGRYDPATGEVIACPPAVRSYYKSTHPNSIDWLIRDLQALGYDRPSFRPLDPEAPGAVDWFGKEIDVTCDHEPYDGVQRERWSFRSERTRKKLSAAALSRLDAQYSEQLNKGFGGGQPAASPPAAPNTSDDPI